MPNLLVSAFDFSAIFENFVSRWYYYLAFFLVLAGLIVFFCVKKQPKRNNLSRTQKITYVAILTAISAVANIFTIYVAGMNKYAVSFISIPCFIAGYLLGAKEGFIVGFIGDLLGVMIAPSGAYLPIIGISSGLWGFIPGIIFGYFKGNDKVKTVISFAICFVVCSAFLNTLGNWLYVVIDRSSTTTFFVYLGMRIWFQAIVCVVNCGICIGLLYLFPRILPKNRFAFLVKKQDVINIDEEDENYKNTPDKGNEEQSEIANDGEIIKAEKND